MKKALGKILDRAYSSASTHAAGSRPSVSTLEIIIAHSNGDIRSALMSLEFLASNPAASGVTSLAGGVGAAKKGKKRTSDGKVKVASEQEVKQLCVLIPGGGLVGNLILPEPTGFSSSHRARARSSSSMRWERSSTRSVRLPAADRCTKC